MSKSIIGVIWSFVQTATQRFVQFGVFLLVAFLLGPAELGYGALMVAPATVLVAMMESLHHYIVTLENIESNEEAQSNAASCCISLGAFFATFLLFVAAIAQYFSDDPRTFYLIALSALAPIFISFGILAEGLLVKKFFFKKLAQRRVCAILLAAIFCASAAYAGFGAFSIIANIVILTLFNSAIAIWFVGFPNLTLASNSGVINFFKSSIMLSANSAVININVRIVDFIVALMTTLELVGIYRLARSVFDAFSSLVSQPLMAVILPMMAADLESTGSERVGKVISVFVGAFSVMGFALVVFSSFIGDYVIIDYERAETWSGTIESLVILSFILPTIAITGTLQQYFVVQERVSWSFKINAFQGIFGPIVIIATWFLFDFFGDLGFFGIVVGTVLRSYLTALLFIYACRRFGHSVADGAGIRLMVISCLMLAFILMLFFGPLPFGGEEVGFVSSTLTAFALLLLHSAAVLYYLRDEVVVAYKWFRSI